MTRPKISASDIRAAMRKQWVEQEWAILWEVREGTGMSAGRSADAVMMSLWPSRGLELHGVEIKVSRSDWKREAADPNKAESVAKYCDRWWIHTSPGVVADLSELPPMWGLREFDGQKWKTIREATKTEACAITRRFLAALLRRSDDLVKSMINDAKRAASESIEEERSKLREGFERRMEEEIRRRDKGVAALREQIDSFQKAFGRQVTSYTPDMAAIGRAAAAIVDCKNAFRGDLLAARLRAAADALDQLSVMTSVSEEDAA